MSNISHKAHTNGRTSTLNNRKTGEFLDSLLSKPVNTTQLTECDVICPSADVTLDISMRYSRHSLIYAWACGATAQGTRFRGAPKFNLIYTYSLFLYLFLVFSILCGVIRVYQYELYGWFIIHIIKWYPYTKFIQTSVPYPEV